MIDNTIINGECLDVLKTLPNDCIDIGITSPPYNKGGKSKGWLVKNVKYTTNDDNIDEGLYQSNQIDILNELYRVIKPGGSFFYNHKLRWNRGLMYHPIQWLEKTKWTIRQEIVWDRMIASNIRGWRFWQIDERIYWLYKPINNNKIGKEMLSKHSLLTSIWKIPPEKNNTHPAPFPIEIPTRIIYSLTDDDEDVVVIDPFCGSGTTMVASKLLNKKYIGIDISKEYVDMTNKRLENYLTEKEKVDKELARHKVIKTFKERKEKGEFTGKYKKKTLNT